MADLRWLEPSIARRIENGRYWLFDMECPAEVMAAYEHLWAVRGRFNQRAGNLLIAWAVEQSLLKGDFALASKLRIALESLGWRPQD